MGFWPQLPRCMDKAKILGFLSSLLALASCDKWQETPLRSDRNSTAVLGSQVIVEENSDGLQTAKLTARTTTQVINATGSLDGLSVTLAPGSLAVSTSLTMGLGLHMNDVMLALGSQGEPASAPIVITSSTPTDLLQPMTLQVPLPSGSSLALQSTSNYAVVYRVLHASTNTWVRGIIPADQLTINDGFCRFPIKHFGAFQVMSTQAAVAAQENADTDTTPVVAQAPAASIRQTAIITDSPIITQLASCEGGIRHGAFAKRVRYASASVPAGGACQQETQTAVCNDGRLSAFSGTYVYESCQVAGTGTPPIPANPTGFTWTYPIAPISTSLGHTLNLNWAITPMPVAGTVALSYKAGSPTGSCSAATRITANVPQAAQSTSGMYNWNTGIVAAAGTYYVCASFTRDANTVDIWSPAPLTIMPNVPPSLTLNTPAPAISPLPLAANEFFPLQWTATDSDGDSLSADILAIGSPSGDCSAGTLVASGIMGSSHNVPMAAIPPRTPQYLCVRISDGHNPFVSATLPFPIVVGFACEWTGSTSSSFGVPANWINCGTGTPTMDDYVNIPPGTINNLALDVTTTIRGFAPSSGASGGTLTVNSGFTLSLLGPRAIRADVAFAGYSPTCSTCSVKMANDGVDLEIANNAKLTLKDGIRVLLRNAMVRVGDMVSSGHLASSTTAPGSSSYWPTITGDSSFSLRGIRVEGVGVPSTVSLNGLHISQVDTAFGPGLHFVNNFNILGLDNLELSANTSSLSSGSLIDMTQCLSGANVATWSNVAFSTTMAGGHNVRIGDNSCTPFTITPDTGFVGNGSSFEDDPFDKITWTP